MISVASRSSEVRNPRFGTILCYKMCDSPDCRPPLRSLLLAHGSVSPPEREQKKAQKRPRKRPRNAPAARYQICQPHRHRKARPNHSPPLKPDKVPQ